jgi:hydrogenase maturation protease
MPAFPHHGPPPRGAAATGRRLVVGLGNTTAGDDGVGCCLARRLEADPRLPSDVDVVVAGLDLLAVQDRLGHRAEILLLDAVLDTGPPGTFVLFEDDLEGVRRSGWSAHHPDPVQALAVLRNVDPALRQVPVRLLGIPVGEVRISESLSRPLAGALDGLVDAVLEILGAGRAPGAAPSPPSSLALSPDECDCLKSRVAAYKVAIR